VDSDYCECDSNDNESDNSEISDVSDINDISDTSATVMLNNNTIYLLKILKN
jgi:hypothetical protein